MLRRRKYVLGYVNYIFIIFTFFFYRRFNFCSLEKKYLVLESTISKDWLQFAAAIQKILKAVYNCTK
jgi:hypothetical protein